MARGMFTFKIICALLTCLQVEDEVDLVAVVSLIRTIFLLILIPTFGKAVAGDVVVHEAVS
jgi:hypothetical protein